MTQAILDLRRRLWANGYWPVPVYTNQKRPFGDDWNIRARANPPEPVRADTLSTGILCDGLRAVDVDVDDPAIAEDVAKLAAEMLGGAPIRWRADSPRRLGLYRAAEGEPPKRVIKGTHAKIEVLGHGQQFVAYGTHPDGADFQWRPADPAPWHRDQLNPLTEEQIGAFLAAAAPIIGADAPAMVCAAAAQSTADNVVPYGQAALRSEVEKVASALQGERNTTLNTAAFRLGQLVGGGQLNADNVRAALFQAAVQCGLVVDDGEAAARATIKSGLAAGIAQPRGPREAVKDGARDRKTALELSKMVFPPIEWVVEDLIVEGLTIFAGKPKIGKSWFVLQCAIDVAKTKGDVIYFALEDNDRRLKNRLEKLTEIDEWAGRLTFQRDLPRLNNGGLEEIEDWLKNNPRTRMIIIDPLAVVKPRRAHQQNAYDADYEALKPLQELAARYRVAIVVVHHLRKMSADDPIDTISGSLGLSGAVDSYYTLRRDGPSFILDRGSRDLPEFCRAAFFDREACTWSIGGDPEEARRSDERQQILRVLSEASEPLGPSEIADKTSMPPVNVRQLLIKMVEAGEVQQPARGKYCLPSGGCLV